METYKLGNKVKAILRAYTPCKIGDIEMKYPSQPYTVLDTTDAQVSFKDRDSSATSTQTLMNYNIDFVDSIQLNNIKLTDKILNLIFEKDSAPLRPISQNYNSDGNGYIYFPINYPVYNLFVYDDEGQLECDPYEVFESNRLKVSKPNSSYLMFYLEDATKGFYLNRLNNIVLSLDLEITGNENNATETFWMHFEKCTLSINKNLYFNNGINTIDLNLKNLKSENDYITLK